MSSAWLLGTYESSSSCKFSKPVASFPGLPKFSRVWFRDYMVVRALALSPGSAQLLLLAKWKRGRAQCLQDRKDGRKDFNCVWVHQPQNSKKSQGVLGNLQHVSCLAVGDRQALSI